MKKINMLLSTIGAVAMMGIVGCGGGSSDSGSSTPVDPGPPPVSPDVAATVALTHNYYNWLKQMYYDGERMCGEWADVLEGNGFNDVTVYHFDGNRECHDFGKIEDGVYCVVELLGGTVPKTCAVGWDTISKEAKETDLEVLYSQFLEDKAIEESNK